MNDGSKVPLKVRSGCLTNESLDIKTPTRDFPIEKVPMSKVKRFELISSDARANEC